MADTPVPIAEPAGGRLEAWLEEVAAWAGSLGLVGALPADVPRAAPPDDPEEERRA